jgi:hypothetical protein
MKPENIDLFIDRLCGVFPKDNIARNTVKRAWSADDYLLKSSVEDCRKALLILEKDGSFPSLPRVKQVLRSLSPVKEFTRTCNKCDRTGYDTGIRLKRDWSAEEETWIMERGTYTTEVNGHEYSIVKRCSCSEEAAPDAETVAMSYL